MIILFLSHMFILLWSITLYYFLCAFMLSVVLCLLLYIYYAFVLLNQQKKIWNFMGKNRKYTKICIITDWLCASFINFVAKLIWCHSICIILHPISCRNQENTWWMLQCQTRSSIQLTFFHWTGAALPANYNRMANCDS